MIKSINDKSFKEEISKNGVYLVDFYANWCGPCMILAPILEEVSNSRGNYNILKMDVDKNSEVINDLKIDTIPTLCVYKDGKLMEKHVGLRSKEEIADMLEKYND